MCMKSNGPGTAYSREGQVTKRLAKLHTSRLLSLIVI